MVYTYRVCAIHIHIIIRMIIEQKFMISFRSLVTFIYLNAILSCLSIIMYLFMSLYGESYFLGFLFIFVKNILFVFGLDFIVDKRNKKHNQDHRH
jgi:hypothetical protein